MPHKAAIAALVVFVGVAAARAADPPAPNVKQPVNYVKWMNEEFTKGLTDNAAELYEQAAASYAADGEAEKLATIPGREWSPAQRKLAQKWVDQNGPAIEKFIAAGQKQRCYFALPAASPSLLEATIPSARGMCDIARLVTVRGQLRLLAGDAQGTAEDAAAVCRAARHMESQPILISYLVGLAMRAMAYRSAIEVPRADAKNVDYDAIVSAVEKGDADPRGMQRQLWSERLMAWDAAQRCLKDQGNGRYVFVVPEFMKEDAPGHEETQRPQTWDEALKSINDIYDEMDKLALLDLPSAVEPLAKAQQHIEAAQGTLAGWMTPSISRVMLISTRATAERRGTDLVLRLHAYHAKNGKWPAELKEVIPTSAPKLGTDPFSEKPFAYRLVKDEPLLYSIGENMKDDGGEVFHKDGKPAWGETGDYVFWPPPK